MNHRFHIGNTLNRFTSILVRTSGPLRTSGFEQAAGLTIAFGLFLAGCTNSGPWPSLLSAQERGMVARGMPVPVTPQQRSAALAQFQPETVQQTTQPSSALNIAQGQLAEQRRAFGFATQRFDASYQNFEATLLSYRGNAEPSNQSWNNIQFSLTRLGQAQAGFKDIIDSLNVMAGDIATLSVETEAQGTGILRILNDIGRLRQIVQQAQAETQQKLLLARSKVPVDKPQ